MTDYYSVLGLSHAAELDNVAKAYRRFALSTNPACNPTHPDQRQLKRLFKLASQAYVVLSDAKLRAIYDQYGDDGVRHGGTGTSGVPGGVDLDAIDPDVVFRKFFGVDSPFEVIPDVSGMDGTQHRFYSNSAAEVKNPPKAPLVKTTLDVTLEDVFVGAFRKATWTNVNTTSRGDVQSEASFEFAIPKGVANGATTVLKSKGSIGEGFSQGDVEVTYNIVPHSVFRREGADLMMVAEITLADALAGVTIPVKTIEGREMSVLVDEVVDPSFRRVVQGEGMPVYGDDNKRGDLIVECATVFPKYLTAEQKSEIRRILNVSA